MAASGSRNGTGSYYNNSNSNNGDCSTVYEDYHSNTMSGGSSSGATSNTSNNGSNNASSSSGNGSSNYSSCFGGSHASIAGLAQV